MIEIAGAKLSAVINPFGAELTHLRDADGRELMTDADPAFWTGHAPILFPVVGAVSGGVIRVADADYQMPKHGFARHSLFTIVQAEPTRALFELTDGAETRATYPFAFKLEIGFRIEGATLSIEARIENRDDGRLPAQFGFHPAFAWPLPYGADRDGHRITFEADEPGELRRILPDGLIAPECRPSPIESGVLRLHDGLFVDDALIWDSIRSQRVTYGAASGPRLEIRFPDTPRLGVWTKPGSRFVCVEPWHGIADPEGFTGPFTGKPGIFEIEPGGEKRIGMSVTLTA